MKSPPVRFLQPGYGTGQAVTIGNLGICQPPAVFYAHMIIIGSPERKLGKI
jgi:hypothetical protein